tara:strand:- start:339 stop:743 length:405 start_codon:yes stop_codon:yes gene_type:complete
MDIKKLIMAKASFFEGVTNLDRKRHNVYLRSAFANAFRPVSKVIDIASVLHRNHSSVVYYCKNHESMIIYDDYKKLYDKAIEVKKQFTANDQDFDVQLLLLSIKDLKEKIKNQEQTIEDLNQYKEKYETIKKVL